MACLGESDGSKKEKIAALPKLSAREPHAFRIQEAAGSC
jgi:hypothetical protein